MCRDGIVGVELVRPRRGLRDSVIVVVISTSRAHAAHPEADGVSRGWVACWAGDVGVTVIILLDMVGAVGIVSLGISRFTIFAHFNILYVYNTFTKIKDLRYIRNENIIQHARFKCWN